MPSPRPPIVRRRLPLLEGRSNWGVVAMLGLGLTSVLALACTAPEVELASQRVEIAPDFDQPICAGTLSALDDHVEFVETSTGRHVPEDQRIAYYWVTHSLHDWCSRRATGCYFPGTRIVAAGSQSIKHEIVHAVLDASADTNIFLEEALASLLAGRGVDHNPRTSRRKRPDELLWLSRRDYINGDLDYRVANHFLHYIQDRRPSVGALESLARVVVKGSDAPEVERAFEVLFDQEFAEVHEHYLRQSRTRYPGVRDDRIERTDLPSDLRIELDCDARHTFGPRYDAQPGMYRVRRWRLATTTRLDLRVTGDEGGWIDLMPLDSQIHQQLVHSLEEPDVRPRADSLRIPVGWRVDDLWLPAGDHIVVFARADYASSEIRVFVDKLEQAGDPDLGPR